LGYEKTLGNDEDREDAEDYFKKDLGLDDKEAEERLSSYGYDEDLKGDKVRLIENRKNMWKIMLKVFYQKKHKIVI